MSSPLSRQWPVVVSPMVTKAQISPSLHSTSSQESNGMETGNVQKEPVTFPFSTLSWQTKGSSHWNSRSSQLVVMKDSISDGMHALVGPSSVRGTQVVLGEHTSFPAQSRTTQKGETIVPSWVKSKQVSSPAQEKSSHVWKPTVNVKFSSMHDAKVSSPRLTREQEGMSAGQMSWSHVRAKVDIKQNGKGVGK